MRACSPDVRSLDVEVTSGNNGLSYSAREWSGAQDCWLLSCAQNLPGASCVCVNGFRSGILITSVRRGINYRSPLPSFLFGSPLLPCSSMLNTCSHLPLSVIYYAVTSHNRRALHFRCSCAHMGRSSIVLKRSAFTWLCVCVCVCGTIEPAIHLSMLVAHTHARVH